MTALAVLNPAALVALTDCEQRIERGLKTFIDVGQALAEIRDSRLYRGTHGTFEDYCRERWGFNDRRASQLIAAADMASTIVETGLPSPTNEGQARALAAVPEPERADVWRETVERTNGKPTAAAVRQTYERTQTPDGENEAMPARATAEDPQAAGESPGNFADPGAGAGDARRDAELDAAMADTDVRFRANFAAALARGDDVWQFDIDRIAELYAASYDTDLAPWLDEMQRWIDRVSTACRQRRSGLRVIDGGNR